MRSRKIASLSTFLNVFIIAAFILQAILLYFVFSAYSASLITSLSEDYLRDESQRISRTLANVRREVSQDLFIFTQSSGFTTAIRDNDPSDIEAYLSNNVSDVRFDHIAFLVPDREIISISDREVYDIQTIEVLLQQALNERQQSTIVVEPLFDEDSDNLTDYRSWIAASTIIRNDEGTLIGAIYVAREFDRFILDTINLNRSDVRLTTFYKGEALLTTELDDDSTLPTNNELLALAETQLLARPDLVFSDEDEPFIELYVPFSASGIDEDSRLIFVSQSEYDTVYNATQGFLTNTFLAVGSVLLLASSAALLLVRRFISQPLRTISDGALKLAEGEYGERIVLESGNEIGQLANTFNQMGQAVQSREEQLKQQNRELDVARKAAEVANEAKSAFLASMSHELRTPLNGIINFTDMVYSGMMGDVNEEQKEFLHLSLDSSRHLLSLINDVLDLSKIQAGKLNLLIADDVNVYDELRTVIEVVKPMLREGHVTLVEDVDDNIPLIEGDRRRIRQIFLNLASNAAKFTKEGTVTISVKYQKDHLLFAFIDTGIGIPTDRHVDIFEPFAQTDEGIQMAKGTGLGLPITKNLVEVHGGRIWLESKIDEGAAFYVTLPIQRAV